MISLLKNSIVETALMMESECGPIQIKDNPDAFVLRSTKAFRGVRWQLSFFNKKMVVDIYETKKNSTGPGPHLERLEAEFKHDNYYPTKEHYVKWGTPAEKQLASDVGGLFSSLFIVLTNKEMLN